MKPRGTMKTDSLFFGIALIGIGVVLLLHQLEVSEMGRMVRHWWPLLIVFLGAGKLLRLEAIWSGLWMIAVGTWLQLVTLRAFGLTYRNSWPLLLIVIGAGSVIRALLELFQPRRGSEESHERQ